MRLGPREKEVLGWTAEGKTASEVGTILGISKRTVEWHLKSVRLKICATNITHAVAIAVKCGVIGLMGMGMGSVGIAAATKEPTIARLLIDILNEGVDLLLS